MKTSHFRLTILVFAAYLVAVLLIGFWPIPVDRPLAGFLAQFISWLHHIGMPESIGYREIEFVANVLFFVPMGTITTLWIKNPWRSIALATYASLIIEILQELLLPERLSSVSDIVANTFGAILGALLFYPLTVRLIHRYDSDRLARKQEYELLENLMKPR